MEDERSELKKRLRVLLGVLVGISAGLFIFNRHAFHDQGFMAFQWDSFLWGAFGAIAALICFGLLGRKATTALGIGEDTTKKLQ
jgi:hypothetical protein